MATTTMTRGRPGPTVSRRSWSRTTRRLLLLVHILTSVGWWGGATLIAAFVTTAALTADPLLADALFRSVGVAVWVTVVGGLLAGASGILLGLGTRWGLVRYRWVVIKEAITVVMIATDLLVVRTGVAKVLAGSEPPSALIGPTMGHVAFLAAATVLSVFKPWTRPGPYASSASRGDSPAAAIRTGPTNA